MLGEIAHDAAIRFGDRPAVVTASDSLTYAELDIAADRVADGLAGRGVDADDVVATVLASCGEWVVLAVALDRLGAIFAPISPKLAPRERADLVSLVAPSLVVADSSTVDGLPLRTAVAVLRPGDRGASLWADPGATGHRPAPPPTPLPTSPDRVTTICFTSGTTGRAKGAYFTVDHQRAVRDLDLGPGAHEQHDGGTAMLASTQFAHVGMAMKLPWYLQTGSTLHVLDPWRADDALRLIAQERIPTIGVVTPQLALMLRSRLVEELDFGNVRSIIAGGAASTPGLVVEARERLAAAYSVRYSSTESGGIGLGTAFDAPDDEALGTIGRPRDGVEARIADPDDGELPDGEIGELQLRSPAVMAGYWNDPVATAAALTSDGWLRTGDKATRRPDGCFVLSGRRTDMYIRGGYNVFPEEVESAMSDHPAVAALAVGPRADEVMGEIGVAVVVPRDPRHPPTLDELRDHAAGRIARHKLPEALLVTDRIPLTTVAKVDRAEIARMVADTGSTPDGDRGRDRDRGLRSGAQP